MVELIIILPIVTWYYKKYHNSKWRTYMTMSTPQLFLMDELLGVFCECYNDKQ